MRWDEFSNGSERLARWLITPQLMRRAVRQHIAPLAVPVLVVLLSSCLFGTDPTPVAVRINQLDLTAEEAATWPTDPVVQGGLSLTVRGTVSLSCAALAAAAERRGLQVDLWLHRDPPDPTCLAIPYPPRPFEVELLGLPLGTYDLRIEIVGTEEPFRRTGNVLESN
jgi:hypothetical protein